MVEPAAMGQALLALIADSGKNPHVMFVDDTKVIGSSAPEAGWGRTQSPSANGVPFSTTLLK